MVARAEKNWREIENSVSKFLKNKINIKLFNKPALFRFIKPNSSADSITIVDKCGERIHNWPFIYEWYFAKGHVEPGETLEQAALREVAEEAGLHHLRIYFLLGSYDRFVKKTNEMKTIHYFLMSPTKDEIPSEPDNKNVELKWFPLEELPIMYLTEQKDVVEKNLERIKSSLDS